MIQLVESSVLLDENCIASLSSKHPNVHPHHDFGSYFPEKVEVNRRRLSQAPNTTFTQLPMIMGKLSVLLL